MSKVRYVPNLTQFFCVGHRKTSAICDLFPPPGTVVNCHVLFPPRHKLGLLEVRWGELLGEGKRGRPENSHASEITLDKDDRHRFRQLAKHQGATANALN